MPIKEILEQSISIQKLHYQDIVGPDIPERRSGRSVPGSWLRRPVTRPNNARRAGWQVPGGTVNESRLIEVRLSQSAPLAHI